MVRGHRKTGPRAGPALSKLKLLLARPGGAPARDGRSILASCSSRELAALTGAGTGDPAERHAEIRRRTRALAAALRRTRPAAPDGGA